MALLAPCLSLNTDLITFQLSRIPLKPVLGVCWGGVAGGGGERKAFKIQSCT